jgi:hypothetical protein
VVEGNLLELDLSSLPLPDETYLANAVWVEREGASVILFFGKTDRDKAKSLKTRVEFRFSVEAFDTLWKTSKEFFKKLGEIKTLLPVVPPMDIGPAEWKVMPAEKEYAAPASIASISHNGSSAEIDFYDLPVMDVALWQRHKDLSKLQVRPLLRVFLTTELLMALLCECERMAEEIRPMMVTHLPTRE